MSKIKIELAHVAGVKADFVKGEVKITMQMSLEQGQALRSISPEMAKEFTRDEVKKEGKP